MTYILINPVTKQMYEEDFLTRFLARHGYEPVECQENWGRWFWKNTVWRRNGRTGRARPEGTILKSSPIPPGFFDFIGKSACVTGAKEIESYLQEQGWKGVKIVELLECSGGCHRGDGVIDLE